MEENGDPDGYSAFNGFKAERPGALQDLTKRQEDAIERICTRHAIQLRLPFSVLCSNLIPDIMGVLNYKYTAPSASKVGKRISTLYRNSRAKLSAMFVTEVVRGCFTYDGWKRFGRKFNGITFHFLDREFRPRSIAIGFEEYFQMGNAANVKEQVGMCSSVTGVVYVLFILYVPLSVKSNRSNRTTF